MDPELKSKIEETVLEILKSSDMESTTEYKVRKSASEKMGIDLSEPDRKKLVRNLSDKRRVTLTEFKGKSLVSIREYYRKDGKELPSSKGISLTAEQWSNFSKNVPAIEKAIKKMEAKC
ncbi:RNA polymerase II transcriptional coactivator KELP [Artemisia annua]|uniref:RNA polymerase II transcriptional coactivator KELP n=1 Tax=Artemisia annua TaxID=35608 RepID=A0A2U1KGS5_ARTAN|nr:RNA polymerase II transcriptional coactivator KELP [Artemisia annua]